MFVNSYWTPLTNEAGLYKIEIINNEILLKIIEVSYG